MKTACLAAAALLIVAAGAQAAPRKTDPFTDGARSEAPPPIQPLAARGTPQPLADEQFRALALRKTDPFTDGAVRSTAPYADGAAKPVDAFTDGA